MEVYTYKMRKVTVSAYLLNPLPKRLLDYSISLIGVVILAPFSLILILLIQFINPGPLFFIQKRVGKGGKHFKIYKFRTMIIDAEKVRNKYKNLNISDGPTFKIPNDPRYTKFGKFLAKSGLDELPQVINVLKGEMSMVGPRPLPAYEAKNLTKSDKVRELVLPGITSSWVVQGAHNLKFRQWMKLDREYIKKASFIGDLYILYQTLFLLTTIGLRKVFALKESI